jgi:hypothetical protein
VPVAEVGSVELLDVGLVEAVVFRFPLVVSVVVLGLEVLVLPYVESVGDVVGDVR